MGFWLAQKRFSVGKLRWWPQNEDQSKALSSIELLVILQQGEPQQVHIPDAWHKLPEMFLHVFYCSTHFAIRFENFFIN